MNADRSWLRGALAATLFGTVTLLAGTVVRAEYNLARTTIDGGGPMRCSGGAYSLSATLGQPDAGLQTGGPYALQSGFWFEEPLGDCDATGIVDLLDYAGMADCWTGPDVGPVAAECNCFDLDRDSDLDLVDFAEFQVVFTGHAVVLAN